MTKRPRINEDLAEQIESLRGDVPFERFVNYLLLQALADHHRPDISAIARAAAEASGLTDEERAAVSAKITANADSGRRPREGLTAREEGALEILGPYMLSLSAEATIAFQRLYWADDR